MRVSRRAAKRVGAPAIRTGSVDNAGSGAALSVTATVAAQAGDTIVAIASTYQQQPGMSGDGWFTVHDAPTTANVRTRVSTRTAVTGNNIVTATRTDSDGIFLIAFAVIGSVVVDASSSAAGTSGTALTVPALTTTQASTLLVGAWTALAFAGAPTYIPPSGMTTLDTTPVHPYWAMTAATGTQTSAGSSGAKTATASASAANGWAGVLIALRPGPRTLQTGVVGWYDAASVCGQPGLGAAVMRVEFAVTDSLTTVVDPVVSACAAAQIKLQPLIGWTNGAATPDLTPLASWASRYGPGGTFWGGAPSPYAITDIELGNENSYAYKSGTVGSTGYNSLATTYGTRALAAAQAINTANSGVKVLVELEDANTGNFAWVDNALASGGSTLISLMRGPTMHPYGPSWATRLDRNAAYLATKGLTKPYYVTETGVSTDNGVSLTDNYGWPVNLTYSQAADTLRGVVDGMAARPTQVRQVILFQFRDQAVTGTTTDREKYFGVTTNSGGDKGTLSAVVRSLFAQYR